MIAQNIQASAPMGKNQQQRNGLFLKGTAALHPGDCLNPLGPGP